MMFKILLSRVFNIKRGLQDVLLFFSEEIHQRQEWENHHTSLYDKGWRRFKVFTLKHNCGSSRSGLLKNSSWIITNIGDNNHHVSTTAERVWRVSWWASCLIGLRKLVKHDFTALSFIIASSIRRSLISTHISLICRWSVLVLRGAVSDVDCLVKSSE